MNIRTLLVPLVFALRATAAHAGGNSGMDQLLAMSLEDLMATPVKIATNTEKALSKAPSVVSVITADDIKATGATNLADILQSVPGVYVKRNLYTFRPLITFRGASGYNVLLMLNGAPVKDLTWSLGLMWTGLPVASIERIEIIRGPGSALFGSDASAGVINVITKTAGKITQTEAGVRAGSYDSQSGWLQYGAQQNGFDVGLTAEVGHTDGHSPYIDVDKKKQAGTAPYGYDTQDFHFSVGHDAWRLLADYTQHRNIQAGLTGGAVLDPLARGSDSQAAVALLYDNPSYSQDWGVNAELRYRDIAYADGTWESPPGPGQIRNSVDAAERRLTFEASGLYSGFAGHAIRLGGGHVTQDLYSYKQFVNGVATNLGLEKARGNGYVFVQDSWAFANGWELTAGARYDRYSDFGGAVNPRLALVWQTTERLVTKLMYGRAFRAPSYYELYLQGGPNTPNPSLKPERSRTTELSVSFLATRDLHLNANVYSFDRRDVIAADVAAPYQFKNYDRSLTRGIEIEAQWQATESLRFAGNMNAMQNLDPAFRDYPIPMRKAYVRADWAFRPQWSWNLQSNWFDKQTLPSGDKRNGIGDFGLLDTTVRYVHDKHWEFAGSIRNLLDVDAREYSSSSLPYNLPLPRRNFFAEARYRF